MSRRIFVVSKENAYVYEDDIMLYYYVNAPEGCENYYIGDIMAFGSILKNDFNIIKDNSKLKNFFNLLYGLSKKSVFGNTKLNELLDEIIIVEELGLITKEDIEIIKTGIKIASKKKLFLRSEGN